MSTRRIANGLMVVGFVVFGLTLAASVLIQMQIYGSAGDSHKLANIKNTITIIRIIQVASLVIAGAGVGLRLKLKD